MTAYSDVYGTLYHLLSQHIQLDMFARWVYDTPTIANVLGRSAYDSLLTFDYDQPMAAQTLRGLVRNLWSEAQPGPETTSTLACGDVAAWADCLLTDTCSFLHAIRAIWTLAPAIVSTPWDDPDFRVFGVIEAQTDHLPLGSATAYLSNDARQRLVQDIQTVEFNYRAPVRTACEHLIERYSVYKAPG